MGNIGDAISTTVPAVSDPETTASAAASALLTEFKTRLTSKVTPSEMSFDAAADINNQQLQNVAGVGLYTQASAPGNEFLYTKAVSGIDELHFRDSAAQDVQITSNGVVNVAASGVITGAGYGSSGVVLNWNSAGSNYQFKSGAGANAYGAVTVGSVQIRDASGYDFILATPTIAADQTLTFPADVTPAGTTALAVDSSGQMAVGGNWSVLSGDTQTIASGGTLSVASGGALSITSWSNFKHGAASEQSIGAWCGSAASGVWSNQGDGSWICADAGGIPEMLFPLSVPSGVNLTSVKIYWRSSTGSPTMNVRLQTISSSGSRSTVSGWTTNTTSAGAMTVTGTPEVTDTTKQYILSMYYTGNSTTNIVGGPITMTYTRT